MMLALAIYAEDGQVSGSNKKKEKKEERKKVGSKKIIFSSPFRNQNWFSGLLSTHQVKQSFIDTVLTEFSRTFVDEVESQMLSETGWAFLKIFQFHIRFVQGTVGEQCFEFSNFFFVAWLTLELSSILKLSY
jgi:hypothetical protein